MKYTARTSEITLKTPFTITADFLQLAFNSLFIGLIFGLLSSYVLKTCRVFSKNPVQESMMIFCFGYLSYVISEVAENSGIISLLTAGVVMAHYTWYNLSPQGKQSSFIVFQFLGYATEAFVFGYLGLTFFTYTELKWSPMLFAIELVVIFVGRFFGTIGLVWFLRVLGYKQEMSMKELIFIWYAGMIRGAIAFGLVLRIDGTQYVNRDVIVTTSLSLVVFTTVFYGSTVGILSNCLFKKDEPEAVMREEKKKDTNKEPLIKNVNDSFESVDLSCSDSSYQAMVHPNQERKQKQRIHTGCAKYLHRFDELIMKPIFIYKYERNMQKKSKEFFNLFMKQGNEIEKEFQREGMSEAQLRESGLKFVQF
jgi:NhaP-type Na+/H+ or K+/H+ antiporter